MMTIVIKKLKEQKKKKKLNNKTILKTWERFKSKVHKKLTKLH